MLHGTRACIGIRWFPRFSFPFLDCFLAGWVGGWGALPNGPKRLPPNSSKIPDLEKAVSRLLLCNFFCKLANGRRGPLRPMFCLKSIATTAGNMEFGIGCFSPLFFCVLLDRGQRGGRGRGGERGKGGRLIWIFCVRGGKGENKGEQSGNRHFLPYECQ